MKDKVCPKEQDVTNGVVGEISAVRLDNIGEIVWSNRDNYSPSVPCRRLRVLHEEILARR